MGILTNAQIKYEMASGSIKIEPFNDKNLGANSYDLTLNNKVKIFQGLKIDSKQKGLTGIQEWVEKEIPDEKDGGGITFSAGSLVLLSTNERTDTPNHVPMIKSRSSIARNGIILPLGAGFGDLGYRGTWTITAFFTRETVMYTNMKFCQIYFSTATGPIVSRYSGKYQDTKEATESKIYKEFE